MTFVPHLFIGIGYTNAMYTLRETYLHETYSRGGQRFTEVRSFHHFNLGQNADEAFAKAKRASENMALPLSTTQEQLDAELRDIKRATPTEIAERQAREEAERARWEAEREERQLQREAYYRDELYNHHLMPFGRYRGNHIDSLPKNYVKWMIDTASEFEGMMAEVAAEVSKRWTDKIAALFPVYKQEYIGDIKEKLELKVRVVDLREINGYYGPTKIITMVDEEGHNITTFASGQFGPDVNSEITIRGTVKAHNEYRGTYQTVLTRVKEI